LRRVSFSCLRRQLLINLHHYAKNPPAGVLSEMACLQQLRCKLHCMRSAVVAMRAFGLLVAFLLSYGTAFSSDYSQKSVAELIDDLTQIDSESVAIHSSYLPPVGFIADETPVSLRTNREGVVVPDAPPQVRELLRRGPVALPELIKHLDDKRPTRLEVGRLPAPYGFLAKYFGDTYDPRVRDWEQKGPPHPPFKAIWVKDTYTLKVGDVCYVLIGQIVHRDLAAVRPVPTGLLVVNSPIEVPELRDLVKSDWGSGDAETVKASLLADIRGELSGACRNSCES
jgi:hypothetical protein